AVADRVTVVRLAEQAVTADPEFNWYTHTAGAAHYRAGQFAEAVRSIRRSLDTKPPWSAEVCNWLVLAMAEHRLGHAEAARQWLDKACRWLDQAAPRLTTWLLPQNSEQSHPHDWLAWHVLR